ncbi:MAG: tetratricopeptide repeat protein [Candidatus Eisenbacteria bacterium]|uniref:Tetratricopeptide repeat protein n=1 Tax=Eiseniibacteriota bacterium TaxID=2212470 RepID=A0A956LVZ7_UNCEI|nr:tetratricopeptide repeat protein [Candidatus Eisenbacteria bacterium]
MNARASGAGTTAATEPRPGAQRWTRAPGRRLILAGLVLAALLSHLTALRAGFVFDDRGLVLKNSWVWEPTPGAVLSNQYWPDHEGTGLYRPVTSFSYWVDGKIWGQHPFGFHLMNLLLHGIVTLLVFQLLVGFFPERVGTAALASLLFAVHPLHSEAVIAIAGRAELLAALFGLGAYLLARRFARAGGIVPIAGSGALLLLATLSKESAAGLLLLPFFHALYARWEGSSDAAGARAESARAWWTAGWVWSAAMVPMFLLRIRILGSIFGLGTVSDVDNPLTSSPVLERVLTALGIQGWVFLKILAPLRLAADYSSRQILPSTTWQVGGLVVAAAGIGSVIYLWRRRDWPLRWAAVFLCASGLLTSNLVFPIGTVFGERLTYLPLVATLWAILVVCTRLFRGAIRPAGIVLLVLWTIALAARTEARGLDWKTNLSLFRAAAEAAPRSVKTWTNIAFGLIEEKRFDDALAAAAKAERINPDYGSMHLAMGSALNQAGRPNEALPYLRRATALAGKRGLNASLEVGNAYVLLGDGARAESVFTAALARDPVDPEARALIGIASARALQGEWPGSRAAWGRAARRLPQDAPVLQRYAYALWQDGAPDSAEIVYRQALGLRPDDPLLRNDLAWFLIESRRGAAEGLRLARTAFADAPTANVADTVLEGRRVIAGCEDAARWVDSLRTAGRTELVPALEETLGVRCPPGSHPDSMRSGAGK